MIILSISSNHDGPIENIFLHKCVKYFACILQPPTSASSIGEVRLKTFVLVGSEFLFPLLKDAQAMGRKLCLSLGTDEAYSCGRWNCCSDQMTVPTETVCLSLFWKNEKLRPLPFCPLISSFDKLGLLRSWSVESMAFPAESDDDAEHSSHVRAKILPILIPL